MSLPVGRPDYCLQRSCAPQRRQAGSRPSGAQFDADSTHLGGAPRKPGQWSSRPASADRELVGQRVGVAAILLPNELQLAALSRAQVELNVGVGRHGLVQIDVEDDDVIVATAKLVDDLAGNHVALGVT